MSSSSMQLSSEEVAHALKEAKARGLPDGWTVKLDKRKRRKWISPTGRTCDSIPKALTMSVELGLLPLDTVVTHPQKRRRTYGGRKVSGADDEPSDSPMRESGEDDEEANVQYHHHQQQDDEDDEDEMEPPTEPETALEVGKSHLTTVHWDPFSPNGQKIGRRIRIADGNTDWKDGRILRYDPCSHRHKIQFAEKARSCDRVDRDNCVWLHLRIEDGVQVATRLVWAHVKGYAWWPAMVMVSDTNLPKEGYVNVEFFGSLEVATLRENPECIRPFDHGKVDGVISKNKKKRNANAVAMAIEEEEKIRESRNEAARFYAIKAFHMANKHGNGLVGKRVQLFRSDINYPYGDTVTGRVRQYSTYQRKWLVSYEVTNKTRKKYEGSWINLQGKEHKTRILDRNAKNDPEDLDLVPFVVGFDFQGTVKDDREGTDALLAKIMKDRCKGCLDCWKKGDVRLTCEKCNGSYHPPCCDPPHTHESYQKIVKGGDHWVCSKCTPCRGCYQKDIVFGSHSRSIPSNLSFPEGETLDLCSMCTKAYDKGQYCPNCAHSWDDEQYQRVQRQIRWQQAHKPKKRGRKRKKENEYAGSSNDFQSFTAPATISCEDAFPPGARVNPTWYHPETAQWGYTEVDMLTCDSCKLWVHAGCAGVTEDEYDQTSNGEHPIYSKEFLCRICCRRRCKEIIKVLEAEDSMLLFAEPVTEKVAPTYHDIIKDPMDLRTMREYAENEEYHNYAWVREKFELMVLNALTFNRYHTAFWKEAKRFYQAGLEKVFAKIGKAAPPGRYEKSVQENFAKAEEAKQMEEDRVQQDKSAEKKDLVAGATVATVTLPKLLDKPPDQASCLPYTEVKLKPVDAYFCSWMDCCYTCGSSGASDTMLFCVDCGEAFHSFCVNAPIHSMEMSSISGWRCPNCKICEISGDAPQDELKMLFCEMCDRAFSLDLLDPALTAAPCGLWICGQCVDCRKCGNTSEPRGASLKYWSRDPQLCYRCGGCDGLVEQHKKTRKCQACSTVWRDDDTDLAKCIECDARVHARCDRRARQFLTRMNSMPLKEQAKLDKSLLYQCPPCSKKHGTNKDLGKVTRWHLHDHCEKVVADGTVKGQNYTQTELYEKLMDQVDWKTRNLWRDEYRKVVLEAARLLMLAKEMYGDPRVLMDGFWQNQVDLPSWMGQRATRFIRIAKKFKIDSVGFSARRIESCVIISKLAASWLRVACQTMGLNTKKSVKGYDRVVKLLISPHECGSVDLPFDTIRCERNRNIINKDEWIEKFEPKLKDSIREKVFAGCDDGDEGVTSSPTAPAKKTYDVAHPLCGWNNHISKSDSENCWYDPRECCLCHMCGDDDAGVPREDKVRSSDPSDPTIANVGRLLPMGDGWWVHASCALWSSETWEAATGGLVNAMEKARSRGAQLRCFGCGRHGATVGCSKGNCSCNYHFPCAYACGAVFTSKQQMYCANHTDCAEEVLSHPSIEPMKTVIIAPEKSKPVGEKDPSENVEGQLCSRVGALVVHSLGEIEQECSGFHSENYITPRGYLATRIFWSTVKPKTRTVYVLKVEKSIGDKPLFTITPADSPSSKIKAPTVAQAYNILVDRVRKRHEEHFSNGDFYSKLPTARRSAKETFGLNGPQFFGFGLNHIRKALESCPGVEAVVAPLVESSPSYRFCYVQPTVDAIVSLQRKRAAVAAERALENTSGCARTEGIKAVTRSGGSGRITRALVRNADSDVGSVPGKKTDPEKAKADRNINQAKYREMKAVPIEQRLVAKRSHIHGWGLFSKIDFPKDSMIVEYMGETIRQCIADKREKQYEISGEGSCYMFRLDLQRIVDATVIGCMARFMNHCCRPNAYAKVITVDAEHAQEKKIMVFALRDVAAGEEITYDYKFPVEDGSLRCTCGAPNCIGRMN